jgi:hypothetical protein
MIRIPEAEKNEEEKIYEGVSNLKIQNQITSKYLLQRIIKTRNTK